MNRFPTVTLAVFLSLFAASCGHESKKAPETPSHLLPASGTEPAPSEAPPGMSPREQAGEELSPASQGPTGPGSQELETDSPVHESTPAPAAGGTGGSGGGGGGGGGGRGGKSGSGAR